MTKLIVSPESNIRFSFNLHNSVERGGLWPNAKECLDDVTIVGVLAAVM